MKSTYALHKPALAAFNYTPFLPQVLLGCLFGMVPPEVAIFPKAISTCHITMTMNGMLQALVGLCTPSLALESWCLVVLEISVCLFRCSLQARSFV